MDISIDPFQPLAPIRVDDSPFELCTSVAGSHASPAAMPSSSRSSRMASPACTETGLLPRRRASTKNQPLERPSRESPASARPAVIEATEDLDSPTPLRKISGHFDGTDIDFTVHLPPKAQCGSGLSADVAAPNAPTQGGPHVQDDWERSDARFGARLGVLRRRWELVDPAEGGEEDAPEQGDDEGADPAEDDGAGRPEQLAGGT